MRALALLLAGAFAAAAPAAAGTACAPASDGVARMCFASATDRYPQGALGDRQAWGALVFDLGEGRSVSVALPEDRVFEDFAPRPYDVDGDGVPEAVVVESSVDEGARLAVYGLRDGELERVAATPEMGEPGRWLAPAAIADLDGDGATEIAYVESPHLHGILRVWRWTPEGLKQIAYAEGWSNHRIGDEVVLSDLRDCGKGPELLIPDLGWTGLFAVRLEADGRLSAARVGAPTEKGLEQAKKCE